MSERCPEEAGARGEWARIGFVAAAAAAFWLLPAKPGALAAAFGFASVLIGAYPILHEALSSLRERRMTMELSMTIALAAAAAIAEFSTALVIILFVLIAEMLEEHTVSQGRDAIRGLLDALPRAVSIRRGGETEEVAASAVLAGDVVIVKPGASIPVDGTVVRGRSLVDQSAITGEALPQEKGPGSGVYAGTVNQNGPLEIRTASVGLDTVYGRIIRSVEEAEKSRAPVQKLADRLAGWLVYVALACAIATFLITRDARSTISVVIVAGACGIAAGTPLAILGAIGRAARNGSIVKGGLPLEILAGVDVVVFDKTGTLTLGEPRVDVLHPAPGSSDDALLEAAAIGERLSEHPLGKAILKKAAGRGLRLPEPDSFAYVPGRGIRCLVAGEEIAVGSKALLDGLGIESGDSARADAATEVLVARGGRFLGSIHISDAPRAEAAEAVARLRGLGIRTVLMTGDSPAAASTVGSALGVDQVEGGLLPDGKLSRIKALMAEGRRVAMIGDGINDVPALMQASLGVAMGSGTDVAHESASIVLLGDDLLKFVETLVLARRCRGIILANFAATLAIDALGIAAAGFGLLNPMLAAFIHVSSELACILNSARLLPRPLD
jgi:Cd2+/Zn2+-exporting ATPase/Cu+-exporting ATPase